VRPQKPGPAPKKPTQSADRIVVRVQDAADAGAAVLRGLLSSLPPSTTIVKDVDRMGRAVLQVPAGADISRIVSDLKEQPGVLYAEPLFYDYGSG
jgi:hypothetical protein